MKNSSAAMLYIVASLMMLLSSCGGGGGGGGNVAASVTVSGVAAAGSPLVGTVTLKDSSGSANSKSVNISADGTYSIDVNGLIPPFILKANGTVGNTTYTLYSFAQGIGTTNVNPLSHLSVVLANAGADPSSIYSNPTTELNVIAAAMPGVISDIQTKLSQLLLYFDSSIINFITDKITADNTGLDQMFDLVNIAINNGVVSIINKSTGSTIFYSNLNTKTLNGVINLMYLPNIFSVYDNWQIVSSGTSNNLSRIAFGNGIFIVVGAQGTILSSTNGITWQSNASGVTTDINKVIYGNGIFIAVGGNGTILTSTNGITWQSRSSGVTTDINCVAYGNGLFVAQTGNGTILTSTNGTTWVISNFTSLPTNYFYNDMVYGNGIFVLVDVNSRVFTSTNGSTWQWNDLTPGTQLQGIAYGNGTFVGVGAGGVVTSINGTSWQYPIPQQSVAGILYGVTYVNSAFVSVGINIIISDASGANWQKWSTANPTTNLLNDVAYGNGILVAVGNKGTILRLSH